ncbi:MAG: hypothetical protein IPM25_06450 [Chloracidobacterium sp.]|nr:hypothetical protein [Chloracidobacterium sp.]
MIQTKRSRREFLLTAGLSAASLPLFLNCSGLAQATDDGDSILARIRKNARPDGAEGMGAINFPANVGTKFDLASDKDKGELMKISGTVFQPDGKTPAANTLIYLYHTDIEVTGRTADVHKHGRYRGWMLTNKDGRYAFVTVAGPVSGPKVCGSHTYDSDYPTAREDWIDSILFEGDRLISAREREEAGRRGGFNPILNLKKGDGGLFYATRDIRLMA